MRGNNKNILIAFIAFILLGNTFFLTGCQQEKKHNPLQGQWVSLGVFLTKEYTEEMLTAREKLILSYVEAYFKEDITIEFFENGTFEIAEIGKGKYEITKDNRLKIMNDLAGVILDYQVEEDTAYIKMEKIYTKLIKVPE